MKAPKEAKVEVRELETEQLASPPVRTTTTDQPVPPETRRTISAALLRALQESEPISR
jgi:hypothetical protein